MSRVSHAQLLRLGDELSERRWTLLRAVATLRLVTGGQLRRRFYGPGPSAARLARLDLAALHEQRILHRLERRIGGRRAGSTGFTYALDGIGQRLLELDRGNGLTRTAKRFEPTVGFVDHALAVSEVWVGLHEYLTDPWTGEPGTAVDFRGEPASWRTYRDGLGATAMLKPDVELRLTRGAYLDHLWIEVDRATEHPSALERKISSYIAYFQTGQEQAKTGVFPLTVWLTTTARRVAVIEEVIARCAPADRALFRVGHLSAAAPLLLSLGDAS